MLSNSNFHQLIVLLLKKLTKGNKKKRARQPLSKNYLLQMPMSTPGMDGKSSPRERTEIERIRKLFLRCRVSRALGSTTFGTRPHKGTREHKGAPKKICPDTLRNDAEVQVDIAMKRRAGEVKAWGMAVEEELRQCGGGCRYRRRRKKCL
jgi:hypothetical protein